VAQLLEGRDAGLRLVGEPRPGLGEARAHAVQLRRQIPDLVPLAHVHPPRELAGADRTRMIAKPRERPADEPVAEPQGGEPADQRNEHRGEGELAVVHVDVAVLRLQRLPALYDGRLGPGDRERDVDLPYPLAAGRRPLDDDVPVRQRVQVLRREVLRRVRLQLTQPAPAEMDHVRPVPIDGFEHLSRARLPVGGPDRFESGREAAPELLVLREVRVDDLDLALDLEPRIARHHGEHPRHETEGELAREPHAAEQVLAGR
jgi:hypothetical protein